jgi:hypothetical protein
MTCACVFSEAGPADNNGVRLLRCQYCSNRAITDKPPWRVHAKCRSYRVCGIGPGTALKEILRELGFDAQDGCGCEDMAARMNHWGVEGCPEHREEILTKLRKAAKKQSWVAKLKAGALAGLTGLALQLDWSDPAPGLLDEALRRARIAAQASAASGPTQASD